MKWLGVILLSGYFLAREKEARNQSSEKTTTLLQDGMIFFACSVIAIVSGVFFWPLSREEFFPAIVLLAAAIPAIFFKGRPVCMIAGAAVAFCVLRFMSNLSHIVMALICVDGLVLVTAFLYQSARTRMMYHYLPELTQKTTGRLLILFSLSVLLTVVYQKVIQLF